MKVKNPFRVIEAICLVGGGIGAFILLDANWMIAAGSLLFTSSMIVYFTMPSDPKD